MHRTAAIALLLLLAATSVAAGYDDDDSPSPSPDSDFPSPTESPESPPSSSPSDSPSSSPANSPSPSLPSSSPAPSPAVPPTAAKAKVPPRGRRGRKGKAASLSSDSTLLMTSSSGDSEMPEELPEDELVPVWDGPTTEVDMELFGAPGPSVGTDAEAVADGAPDEGEDPGFKRRKLMALDELASVEVN